MIQETLEAAAKEARRKADIAKHKPLSLDTLDAYGEEEIESTCWGQGALMQEALNLHGKYMREHSRLWDVIYMLRADALYWRQKCEETEKLLDAKMDQAGAKV